MKNARVSGVFEVSAAPDNGVSSFKQTVFIRQDSTPYRPTGGSYDSPYPDEEGWEDGIPAGSEVLWASTRVFSSDGNPPQQAEWSVPRPMADTSNFQVRYSSKNPPSGNPDEAPSEWSSTGSDSTIYIATRAKEDGAWGDWAVTKIVGENAEYYTVSVGASTIKRGASGYVPYLIPVGKYFVSGSSQTAVSQYYIMVFGLKGDESEHIYTIADGKTNFNVSPYFAADYDGFMFCLRESEASNVDIAPAVTVGVSRDGEKGENAQYYTLEVGTTLVKRGASAYTPSSFKVGEYYIDGAAKSISTEHYILMYGIKGTSKVHKKTLTGESTLDVNQFFSNNYDGFMFCLRESEASNVDIAPAVTVGVSRDGDKGYKGARVRMTDWVKNNEYLSGVDDEKWIDIVKYEGLFYLCLKTHSGRTSTPKEDVIDKNGIWEETQKEKFIATDLMLADRIKSEMIDTDDLVAKRIYTDPIGVVFDENGDPVEDEDGNEVTNYAHIEIVGSEMKVFNQLGLMNIRFGVNEEGYAVLEYYDNAGRKLYDLGPEGITMIPVSEESWTELWYEKLGDSISEVLKNKDYTRKLFDAANKVYKYHSKIVAGVVDDEENNGRLFASKALNDEYVLEDGIYRIAPSSNSGNNVFMSIDSSVIEAAMLEGKTELDSTDLPGLSSYNERVMAKNPVYAEQLYRCEGGFMASSGITAYWNGKPVAS